MKRTREIIALFALTLVFVLEGFAQTATSVQPSRYGDRSFKMDTVFSIKPMREDDKMFTIDVWRRIDLREKYNIPLYGTGDAKLDGIVGNIYKAIVEENAFEVYADESFTRPMSISEFQSEFWLNALGDSIFIKQLYYLDLKEDFIIDKHHSQARFDIKYLELVMPSITNANAGQKSIGFIKFKDFYNHFKDHPEAKWFNFQNTSKSLGYDHVFDVRLFRSVVRKYTNQGNDLLIDLVDPNNPNAELQAFLNALEFEYKLLEFENGLWEW